MLLTSLDWAIVVLSIIVIATAVIATIKAVRQGGGTNTEDTPVASRTYAPAGLIATPAEKELEAQWLALDSDKRPVRSGH